MVRTVFRLRQIVVVLTEVAALAASLCAPAWAAPAATAKLAIRVSFPSAAHQQPITGRLFVMISRTNEPEVRLQSTWFNSPEMVAVDVHRLQAQQTVTVDGKLLGTPLRSMNDLAPGDYFVQAILNIYTEFHRADGRTVWAHMDHWEGQQFSQSPGNLYSKVAKLHIDRSNELLNLSLSEVIPLISFPEDTEWVKYVRIQSKLLSKFWGQPIYMGAVVLLPKGYAKHKDIQYPVIYNQQGHYSLSPPFNFRSDRPIENDWDRAHRESAGYATGFEFQQSWQSEHFPRMIAVSFLDPTPFSDWSGGVNSVNNGPYGDAIVTELIPYIEQQFRIIHRPSSRVLTGKNSGGRAALALQLLHPELFGGAWIFQPWAFNFQRYFTVNIYDESNAFEVSQARIPRWARSQSNLLPAERQLARTDDGIPLASFRQLSQHDAVLAGMAGGDCIGADDAILGPVGKDGYPQRLWDRTSGAIDSTVAKYWHDHGDLAYYAQANWTRIGPQLDNKLHFYVGEMDTFERNQGVHLFQDFLETTRNPHFRGTFEYAPTKGDWQPMTDAQLVQTMADHIARNEPAEAVMPWRHD